VLAGATKTFRMIEKKVLLGEIDRKFCDIHLDSNPASSTVVGKSSNPCASEISLKFSMNKFLVVAVDLSKKT
jgi:hypothetical protein